MEPNSSSCWKLKERETKDSEVTPNLFQIKPNKTEFYIFII